MASWRAIVGVVMMMIKATLSENEDIPTGILEIHDHTFDQIMEGDQEFLVYFYAPWCTHCQAAYPTVQDVVAPLKNKGISVVAVDATKNTRLAQKFSVHSYPIIKFLRLGRAYAYEDLVSTLGLLQFAAGGWGAAPSVEVWTGPSYVVPLSLEGYDQAMAESSDDPWFLMFYAPWCLHSQGFQPYYEALARTLRGQVHVAMINGDKAGDLADAYDITGFPTLFLIRGGLIWEFTGNRTQDAMVAFALYGYKQLDSRPIPARRWLRWGRQWQAIQAQASKEAVVVRRDAEEMMLYKKNTGLLVFACGVAYGLLLVSLCRCACRLKGPARAVGIAGRSTSSKSENNGSAPGWVVKANQVAQAVPPLAAVAIRLPGRTRQWQTGR